eukprot:NODE_3366_length_1365_cov_19.149758_g2930_i0.p1 GENE.NODE_3366_length_1365_cov_19.149758_g2930_i0~~NODE_3366_length_1365_cov_19.149758_g2930_i0.p1  ORF type:complete len:423 (+),score=68.84 NODE_3366_length_1365_cov_19.149758_g2930_i0:96-1271(+)
MTTLAVSINLLFLMNSSYLLYILGALQCLVTAFLCFMVAVFDLPLTLRGLPGMQVAKEKGIQYQLYVLRKVPLHIWGKYLYHPIMFISSVLGMIKSPFFFSVQLLSMVEQSPALQNVTTAITSNARTLFMTVTFAVIVVYLFTVIAYELFLEDFKRDGNPVCTTFLQCFIWTLSNGLRSGGGLGDQLPEPKWESPSHNIRVTFDLFFFGCVNIGLINMVFGIIIDAFANLRDERQSRDEDQHRRCFICGIDADTFNRFAAGGFENHVRRVHYMWNYLHFLHYLKRKPSDEYTGQESYVDELMNRNNVSFFPLGKASDLIERTTEEEQDTEVASNVSSKAMEERLQAMEEALLNLSATVNNNRNQPRVEERLKNLEMVITNLSVQLTQNNKR